MKTIKSALFALAFAIAFASFSFAQDVQFSSNSKAFMLKVQKLTSSKSSASQIAAGLQQFYPVRTMGNQNFIGALIMVGRDIDQQALKDLDVHINTRLANIWSVTLPVISVEKLGAVKGLTFVDVDGVVDKKLDNATTECKVKEVQAGTGIPRACLGDSVIVGIVDDGFDYTHPTFYDAAGSKYRVLRAWEQDNKSGTPPAGFNYGTEFVGTQALIDQKSSSTESHGTHVAGIAAGSGYLTSGNLYKGVAPAAEMIFVNSGEAASAITDGINYIFQQAAALNRPAVVNLSLGSHIGPHDGTSLMDQTIDGLVGTGRIVAGAAGNEGDTPLHLYNSFTGDTIKTFVAFEDKDPVFNTGKVDMWGSANSDFSVSLSFSDNNLTILASTPFYSASANPNVNQVIMVGGDSINFIITGVGNSPLNQKPNILAEVNRLKRNYIVTLIVTGTGSQVHIWNHGISNGASLYDTLNNEKIPSYTAGNTVSTTGEIGGTSKKIITVGAYVTKDSYVNMQGKTMTSADPLNQLASFSSRGPTVDGRTKPEICAPGEKLVSSVNSYDTAYNENNEDVVLRVEQGTTQWYFAAMQGTSMATPMTTGIIALMLQANPFLGPERIKQFLQESARTDSYTGPIGPEGSNDWGWGKIDALKSVQAAFNCLGIDRESKNELSVYPNPSRGIITLKNAGLNGQRSEIVVQDMMGCNVLRTTYEWSGWDDCRIDLSGLPSGLYLLGIRENMDQMRYVKVQLIK